MSKQRPVLRGHRVSTYRTPAMTAATRAPPTVMVRAYRNFIGSTTWGRWLGVGL